MQINSHIYFFIRILYTMDAVSVCCAIVIVLAIIIGYYFHRTPQKKSEHLSAALPVLKKYQKDVEDLITEDLRKNTGKHAGLMNMCEYALDGGKKIRSIIALSIIDYRGDRQIGADSAIAVEYLHAASLILDDIADKDDYRRGRKAVHKVYGVGKAQMCALYLIGQAGRLMQTDANRVGADDFKVFIYDNLFANLRKLIEGQYIDIAGSTSQTSAESLMHKKTGTMFEIPFILSWSMSHRRVPNNQELISLKDAAKLFGQIFQIADDFEDMESDRRKNSQFNYVLNNGMYNASEYFSECVAKFSSIATSMNIYTKVISETLTHLVQKCKM